MFRFELYLQVFDQFLCFPTPSITEVIFTPSCKKNPEMNPIFFNVYCPFIMILKNNHKNKSYIGLVKCGKRITLIIYLS